MSSEPLVDLLLVRLGRDEEKNRVRKLLVSGLQMTEEDAANAVENSPSVLMEAISMEEAREIQKQLYPFIDLLPRIDETTEVPPPESEDSTFITEERSSAYEAVMEDIESDNDDISGDDQGEILSKQDLDDSDFATESESDMVITSASEEMLQIERCHICGRTPTDGEKLAPCRTCGELTCRNCLDRVAHVCQKCSDDGKVVSHPLHGSPDYMEDYTEDRVVTPVKHHVVEDVRQGNRGRNIAFTALVIIILGGAFYFMDPLDLFSTGQQEHTDTDPVSLPDTVSVQVESDSQVVVSADSTNNIPPDSTVAEDTDLPLGFVHIQLSDSIDLSEDIPTITRYSGFISGSIRTMRNELGIICPYIERIAAYSTVEVDRITLVSINDSTIVLAMSVLHPEDNTGRYKLLNGLADFSRSSELDQIVLYYKENRFQNISILTYTSESFTELVEAASPQEFQSLAGTYGGDVWELISGEIQNALTSTP